jgi:hypothetical protein
MPRAPLACEVNMLSMQTADIHEGAAITRLLQEHATQTGHIPERATHTGHIQDRATLTGHIQERATLTGHIQERATHTGHVQEPADPTEDIEERKPATILSDEIKAFIVGRLARYETPTQVVEAVKKVFDVEVNRQQVFSYHARGSRKPAEKWCELFEATREAFLTDFSAIGIAQKAVRLRMLERYAQHAEERGHYTRAAGFLEQIAKECGGIYEGKRSSPAQP